MAKGTTATVTVGADTRPFQRQMKQLGGRVGGAARGVGGGIARGAASVGRSALGTGLGIGGAGLAFMGARSLFDELRAVSPEFAGAMNKLSVAFQDMLLPAAKILGQAFLNNMPAIQTGLNMFGSLLAKVAEGFAAALPIITDGLLKFGELISDAVKFWTEDAFDPKVWKDIGEAIAQAVKDAFVSPFQEIGTKAASAMIQNKTVRNLGVAAYMITEKAGGL